MSGYLRVGGRGRLADGAIVIWTLAEGARGRRWRWVIDDVGIVRHAGLLELDRDGTLARLELWGSSGLLTLHPEADGSIHGNVVDDAGIRPIAEQGRLPVQVHVEDDAFGSSLLGRRAGEGILVLAGHRVSIGTMPVGPALDLDVRGVPILDEATEWQLELTDGT